MLLSFLLLSSFFFIFFYFIILIIIIIIIMIIIYLCFLAALVGEGLVSWDGCTGGVFVRGGVLSV